MEGTLEASTSDSADEITQPLDGVRTVDSDLAETTFPRRANQAKWPLALVLGLKRCS